MKICKHCGGESRRKNRHGNPSSCCQKCSNKQTNDYKYRNPDVWMLLTSKLRAKKAGLPFNLTRYDIEIPTHCPILGIKLEPGTKKYHEASPSLDRFIPELGYVRGNVAVISFRANRLKGDGTIAELEKVIGWMKEKQKSMV